MHVPVCARCAGATVRRTNNRRKSLVAATRQKCDGGVCDGITQSLLQLVSCKRIRELSTHKRHNPSTPLLRQRGTNLGLILAHHLRHEQLRLLRHNNTTQT